MPIYVHGYAYPCVAYCIFVCILLPGNEIIFKLWWRYVCCMYECEEGYSLCYHFIRVWCFCHNFSSRQWMFQSRASCISASIALCCIFFNDTPTFHPQPNMILVVLVVVVEDFILSNFILQWSGVWQDELYNKIKILRTWKLYSVVNYFFLSLS